MANDQQLEILKQGPKQWNDWRKANPQVFVDLTRVDLRGIDFRSADLSKCDLSYSTAGFQNLWETNLAGSELHGTQFHFSYFSGVNLIGANLAGAGLEGVLLHRCDCTRAAFMAANLEATHFLDTAMEAAIFTEARLTKAVFAGVDLTKVIGLETCRHSGPTTLDHQTLILSGGRIPLTFLRGCGLPDDLINYLPSLLGKAIEFYSCFISYSSKDQGFAERLHADLQNKGVRCWFAPEDLRGGKKIHEQIDNAIRTYDKLLLILSPESMSSNWVKTEISKTRKRELKEKRRMLFPVRLVDFKTISEWECFDADTGMDSAKEIREYFIPDFASWKTDHDAYKTAFQRLLQDLNRIES